jgi:hypothetical protein
MMARIEHNEFMVISDAQLEQFQLLYKTRYGTEIGKEKAYEQGIKLLRLLKRIYKPMTESQFDAVQQWRAETLPAMLTRLALQDTEEGI